MLTIPNLISLVRLFLIPVFLWLLFGKDDPFAAGWLLGFIGATDWVDGYLARRLDQVSEVGKFLDPLADRLAVVAAVVGGLISGDLPKWFAWALIVREVVISIGAVIVALKGHTKLDVRYMGKLATLLLYMAIAWFFVGAEWEWAKVLAWLVGVPGLVLYYIVGFQYAGDALRAIRHDSKCRGASSQLSSPMHRIDTGDIVQIPEGLRYTENHEWVAVEDGTVRVGITDFAQDALGDVVFVDLPATGAAVSAGEPFAEIESTKSVADVYAPISGTVVAANDALADAPEMINSDPYGTAWFVVIEGDVGGVSDLMDPAAYEEYSE